MTVHLFRVSEVAREVGCSEAFIRRAEKAGKIPIARRDLNGWRIYSEDDIERLRRVFIPAIPVAEDDQESQS